MTTHGNDDVPHKIVRDLGIAPQLDIEDDQRLKLLRELHQSSEKADDDDESSS